MLLPPNVFIDWVHDVVMTARSREIGKPNMRAGSGDLAHYRTGQWEDSRAVQATTGLLQWTTHLHNSHEGSWRSWRVGFRSSVRRFKVVTRSTCWTPRQTLWTGSYLPVLVRKQDKPLAFQTGHQFLQVMSVSKRPAMMLIDRFQGLFCGLLGVKAQVLVERVLW